MRNIEKPFVSFILFAFNQEKLITEAVESLLSQDYDLLEIILSDDASSDNTFKIMESIAKNYKGKHTIKLNRNENNLGICAHINKLLSLTEGELIFCAAGDDISFPDRCSRVVAYWLEHNKKPDLIATDALEIKYNGTPIGLKPTASLDKWQSIEDWFEKSPFILGATHTWSRNLIERFGELDPEIRGEDHIMTFRAILTGSAMTLAEPLVKHRLKDDSDKAYKITAHNKRQEIIKGNINSLASIRQHISDAKILDKEELVTNRLKNALIYEQTIYRLFNSDSFFQKLEIVINASQLDLIKKVRFFTYAAFPWIMGPFFFIKSSLLHLSNKQ